MNLHIRFWAGPILTLAAALLLVTLEPAYALVFDISLAPLFTLIVLSAFIAGWRSAMFSFLIFTGMEYLYILPHSYGRFCIEVISGLTIVILGFLMEKRFEILLFSLGSAESVSKDICDLVSDIDYILDTWDRGSASELKIMIYGLRRRLAETATKTRGFHILYKEMVEVKRDYGTWLKLFKKKSED